MCRYSSVIVVLIFVSLADGQLAYGATGTSSEEAGGANPTETSLAWKDMVPPTFTVEVTAPKAGDLLTIDIHPKTLKVNQAPSASFKLPAANSLQRTFTVDPPQGQRLSGPIQITAELTRPAATPGNPGQQIATLAYEVDNYQEGLPLSRFLALGVLGILLGYVLRLFIQILEGITPPPLAPLPRNPDAKQPGPISRWVAGHYYQVDCLVTVFIGFLVLVSMIQGNRTPETGAYWYSALAVGVGLGLLTNSNLLTRLRR